MVSVMQKAGQGLQASDKLRLNEAAKLHGLQSGVTVLRRLGMLT